MFKTKFLPLLTIPFLFSSIALAQAPADLDGRVMRSAPMTAEQIEKFRLDACSEWYGDMVGRMASLETRLNLADPQKKLWNDWTKFHQTAAMAQKERCIAGAPRAAKDDSAPLGAVEIEKRMEVGLSERLQALQSSRPALEALYASLNADQKETFDRFFGDRGYGRGHMMGRGYGSGPMMGCDGPGFGGGHGGSGYGGGYGYHRGMGR